MTSWPVISKKRNEDIDCLLKSCVLSGILAKSGPLDFATKNSFPLFLFVKTVWYTCLKTTLFIFQFFTFALLQAKNQSVWPQRTLRAEGLCSQGNRNGVSGGDRKAEIYGFWEASCGQLDAVYEILLGPSI